MTEEALNALRALVRLPIEELADCSSDDSVVFFVGSNGSAAYITVGHVRDAREALKTSSDAVQLKERLEDAELALRVWDHSRVSEYWLRHPSSALSSKEL
ncbi:hypothetical protein CO683_00615 [Bradyrhizobium ottawaense]|uniref:hypothetical protein n=1 Tax=Bradyrhizobium ottawaense TaxID=931866 RepID=UPI000BE7925E|nr:hypothetical protein [Bradyrhizobium ottawaense]PDT71695.1 hypothetical protein CO683_00615 [Bradyrhizobium ottawaense]